MCAKSELLDHRDRDAGDIRTLAQTIKEDHQVRKTRFAYDAVARFYAYSSRLLHTHTHARAVEMSGLRDGMRVLDAGAGSGELLQQITQKNPSGISCGVDLSPVLAAQTTRRIHFGTVASCAGDLRRLPFASGIFDVCFASLVLEALPQNALEGAMGEILRVVRPMGSAVLVLLSQRSAAVNLLYRCLSASAPAFWGRQVERNVIGYLRAHDLQFEQQVQFWGPGFPNTVVRVYKPEAWAGHGAG